MKKIILASTAIFLSFASFAQKDSTNNMMNNDKMGSGMNHQGMDKSHGDGVMMMNGKMMMEHSGKMTMMDHDTTMNNGTKVMTNGTCIKKDGTKIMMKEGQHMNMSGKMMPMKDPVMKK
ncbi:MAG: hypothetical protein JJE25_08185 [Bacteroidia bacterium]|nr:hypothetical protein [Bacteroidia bacterium]